MITREEHLEWCKRRALAYVAAGDLLNACASMMSDIPKHPETQQHIGLLISPVFVTDRTPQMVRDWIEGFQ